MRPIVSYSHRWLAALPRVMSASFCLHVHIVTPLLLAPQASVRISQILEVIDALGQLSLNAEQLRLRFGHGIEKELELGRWRNWRVWGLNRLSIFNRPTYSEEWNFGTPKNCKNLWVPIPMCAAVPASKPSCLGRGISILRESVWRSHGQSPW